MTFASACSRSKSRIFDLALFAHAVVILAGLEVARNVGIVDRDLAAELVCCHGDHLQLHLLVAQGELPFDLRIGDRHPVGERGAQLVDREAATQVLFERGLRQRRELTAEDQLVALLPDEAPVLLEAGYRENSLRQFLVAHREALAFGFDHGGLLVDHLLQDLLVDAELTEDLVVEAATVRGPVRLHLRVVSLQKLAGRDGTAVDFGNHLGRRGSYTDSHRGGVAQKAWDVKDDESEHHQGKTPLEPTLVATHPIQHGH